MAATKTPIPQAILQCDIATPPSGGRIKCPSPWMWANLSDSLVTSRVWWKWCCLTSELGQKEPHNFPGSPGDTCSLDTLRDSPSWNSTSVLWKVQATCNGHVWASHPQSWLSPTFTSSKPRGQRHSEKASRWSPPSSIQAFQAEVEISHPCCDLSEFLIHVQPPWTYEMVVSLH